jgi:carbamoyltransferase
VNILGISAYYHDSAACLVRDGVIVAAAEEERFSRKKHDEGFPRRAVDFVLREGGIGPKDLDVVGFYDKPVLKFSRILETFVSIAPLGLASWMHFAPAWMRERLWVTENIRREMPGYAGKVLFTEHHESHAASAFFPSPFERAAILTMDGVGEWATSSVGVGEGSDVKVIQELRFPHSLGLLYSAFTYWLGFKVNSGEYKVMGLAPYGEPKYAQLILDKLMDLKEDGSFRMNLEYFGYVGGLRMTSPKFDELFGRGRRPEESRLEQIHMDVARSIQAVTEEVMLRMARYAHRETGAENLCMAGGVALNCVGNGRILREGPFKRLWIQPAAGDAGGALGVALALWHKGQGNPRTVDPTRDSMRGAYLGPSYSDEEIAAVLEAEGAPHETLSLEELPARVAELIDQGNVVGWFQGRAEFGPRALGARSILGDPRSRDMQKVMNEKIKFRESFRPFAPSVLEEKASEWFEIDCESPYMLLVAPVAKAHRLPAAPEDASLVGTDRLKSRRSEIPAVTHVDFSARLQTVSKETNPLYWELIRAFEKRTGCPVLVNTSFNVRGEPMVCTPLDALRCFRRTGMDYLVLGRRVLAKSEQPALRADEQVGALAMD